MRFAYHPSMCDPSFYLELGKAAETAGFDVITFPDSICYPKECDSTYPYNDDGSREFSDCLTYLISACIDNNAVVSKYSKQWNKFTN